MSLSRNDEAIANNASPHCIRRDCRAIARNDMFLYLICSRHTRRNDEAIANYASPPVYDEIAALSLVMTYFYI
jgi:hypothetical protein